MHILHALTHSILGGGQAVPFLLIKNLQRNHPEIRHTVLLPPGGAFVGRFRALDVGVVEFPLNAIRLSGFLSIRSLVKKLGPDIIHTHGRGAGVYLRSIPKRTIDARRFHTHHGLHTPEKFIQRTAFIMTERFLNANTDVTVAVSESEREQIAAVLRSDKGVVTIPNVVDTEEVRRLSREPIPPEYRFGKFPVVMIGRDDPVKNYPLAVAAAEMVLSQSLDVCFYFVGIEKEHTLLHPLQKKYPDNIIVTGVQDNPLGFLKHAAILLITSKREGAPLTVLEALALGKPVVGTTVRGIRDFVTSGRNGILTDSRPDDIAKAILSLSRDNRFCETLARNALAGAGVMDPQKWAEQYYQLYRLS